VSPPPPTEGLAVNSDGSEPELELGLELGEALEVEMEVGIDTELVETVLVIWPWSPLWL
jgi:hypothetical protein